jgi:hypothetical protein
MPNFFLKKPLLFGCLLIAFLAAPVGAQVVEIPESERKPFAPIDAAELATRYPEGKKWRSISVLNAQGTGSSKNWGIEGTVHLAIVNRYFTQVTILENMVYGEDLTLIKMRVDIIEASGSKIISRQKLRLIGPEASDPIFAFVLKMGEAELVKISPIYLVLKKISGKVNELDPGLERILTGISRRIGLINDLSTDPELTWFEEPQEYSGCSFEVEWMNGSGVTKVKQVKNLAGEKKNLEVSQIRRWMGTADPLAELYFFPSLNKRIGDRWTVDASRASTIFSGDASAVASGKLEVHYVNDGDYSNQKTRDLRIEAGNVQLVETRDVERTIYTLSSMTGRAKFDHQTAGLLMSNGEGSVQYNRVSTNHILFEAKLNRDMQAKWRFETEVQK